MRYDLGMDASQRTKPRPHEIPHPTLSLDTDAEAERIQLAAVPAFVDRLGKDFYLDDETIRRAITRAAS
jgi:hypothetical protein